jgi:hypothetical protein
MTGFNRGFRLAVAVLALALAAPVGAQENLDSGKSGAQLYASDCAICHKSPQGLAKAGGLLGLSSFLQQHYTASRESAATVAKYLESLGNAPAPAKRVGKRKAKSDDKAKADEKKPETAKPGEEKSTAKPAGGKSTEPKNSESKSDDAKSSKPKAAEAKASKPKPAAASAAKPKKPENAD